ncbi:DUF445 domain-containing protein [Clostridium saccharoperbutylacetonicum]|uniref:DUF445 domain-containing protein n=1 Tax=Clostridium saccharoperbutylacetonicum TaxID=36745 RepID=UPI000983DC0E|nr:DUF445 domain-containing protein [Clostridium saccharoperbutylacetonicum]AQR95321.1 hypothetical protein CLSAP_26370 [Clostridium saccharoperbutylacetonicum]NSB31176.1 uncharacterized membrane-anchored protein YjiN (DUF445 family) [Clostridium saccharoperbutylacetonicum]
MKNKKLANKILVFLFLGFCIITLFRIFILDNFTVRMLSFTIEAALVGGIADWFAVTALFNKPLGFPWHTAIIPKNRDKVIEAVSVMVESELLSPKFLEGKIQEIHIIDLLIAYIDKHDTKKSIAKLIAKYGQEAMSKINGNEIAGYIEAFLKNKIKSTKISPKLKMLVDWAIKNGEYDNFLEKIIDGLIVFIKKDSTRVEIYNILNDVVQKRKSETNGLKQMLLELSLDIAQGTNSLNLKDAAISIQETLLQILINMKDKNDPMYIRLDEMLKENIKKMETDLVIINSIENWKEEIISKIQLREELQKLIDGTIKITANLPAEIDSYNTEWGTANNAKIIKWLLIQVNRYWLNFKQDEKIKKWLEAYIKESIMKVLNAEHHLVGTMVKETLNTFTDEALNEFIESKAGNDLHWIRINGSIVGAVVGVILYLFVNLFYGPVVAPIIRGWFPM